VLLVPRGGRPDIRVPAASDQARTSYMGDTLGPEADHVRLEEVTIMDEWEMRLHGTGLADGEISLTGLAGLAQALQVLAIRVGRHLGGVTGPGRSPLAIERATTLRLRGIAPGSTILQMAIGEDGVLGDGLEQQSLDALLQIFYGIASDEAPDWVTPLVGEATVALIDAVGAVSTQCTISTPNRVGPPNTFTAASASREVWTSDSLAEPGRRSGVSVSGELDLVDLRRGRLRVRDALGNDVQLDAVANVDEAARLVGEQVTATGDAVLGSRGQITSLEAAFVERLEAPSWVPPRVEDVDFGRRIDTGGVEGVDDDEVTTFLELIGR